MYPNFDGFIMLETSSQRKNKICLADYNYRQDLENRLLMAQFSSKDLEVLEEILYSSISIPIRKLEKNLDLTGEELIPILQKLSKTGLFSFENDSITVDKEMRKYFEAQILKFDPEFKPGMEFLQSLLRKVPIHVLPAWYAIPRTSNNIFDSLVEKYLLTPLIFQRYLVELHFINPTLASMVDDVYSSPELKLYAKDLMDKYELTREQFEEYLLYLEFSFVCCLGYTKVGDEWKESVTPFYEWKEYLSFLQNTEPSPIVSTSDIKRFRPQDFSFIQDLSVLLQMAKKQPIPLSTTGKDQLSPNSETLSAIAAKFEGFKEGDPALLSYLNRLIAKMRKLKLANVVDNRLYSLEAANDWLDMRPENRAMFLYRHPLNSLESSTISALLCTDRNIREAEKSIQRVVNRGWVYFDDFIRGAIAPLSEESIVMLKRQGKTWKYTLPSYSDEELTMIRATILDWLFEVGVTAVGSHLGRDCFCVTPFGQSLFGR